MPYVDDLWIPDEFGTPTRKTYNSPMADFYSKTNSRKTYSSPKAGVYTNAGAGTSSDTGASSGASGLKNAFAGWKNKASTLGNTISDYINPNAYGWTKGSGLKFTNPSTGKLTNLGKWSNIAGGVMQGVDALGALATYGDLTNDANSLQSNIRIASMGNPLLSSYLTPEQLSLLSSIEDGRYNMSDGYEFSLSSLLGGLTEAVPAALIGGATGGIPGAVIGGVGSLINSGLDSFNASNQNSVNELQALYTALQDANAQYQSMKRPNFTGLGIQQRYQNMYA